MLKDDKYVLGIEHAPQAVKDLLEYLQSAPTIYTRIGSSALFDDGINDYDFVCHKDNLTNFIIDRTIAFDLKDYVTVMPMGNGWLFRDEDASYIDILVYDDKVDVLAIKATMDYLQRNLVYLEDYLRVKDNRVKIFEALYKRFQSFYKGVYNERT